MKSRKRPRSSPSPAFHSESGINRSKTEQIENHENENGRPKRSSTKTKEEEISASSSNRHQPILTPHIQRLLRLVEDGTADHAKMAAIHLNELTANCSPLVLWEILGRLQAFLVSKQWSTRFNAGLAMEGVAKHLPVEDQEAFLSQDHRYYSRQSKNQSDSSNALTSLTIPDLEGNMSTILEKGRLLVAAAESKFQNKEEDELEDLNQSSEGYKNFCEMRLETQRRILARRLGLSNILVQYTTDCDQLNKQLIDQEDIVRPTNIQSTNFTTSKDVQVRTTQKKKQKRRHKDSVKTRLSISALLTTEIRKQNHRNDSSKEISHRTAQALLAGELMFRIFDPSWHVRHGSLIGILALIRAWKSHRHTNTDVLFGAWPHDILARVVCVLALDRFGDYSGVSAEAAVAGGMVAPIREMAGQVFALVFILSPTSLQQTVRDLLNKLLRHDEWETRHGALLAIKYTVVLMATMNDSDRACRRESYFLSFFAHQVISGLEDSNDDVKGVAAQILSFSVESITFDGTNFLPRVVRSLWNAVEKIRVVSSCINDLVKLLSKLIQRNVNEVLEGMSNNNSPLHGMVQIFSRTSELLDCELISVKVCILQVIGALSKELVKFFDEQIQSSISNVNEAEKNKARSCYSKVIKNIYQLLRETSLAISDKSDSNVDNGADLRILNHSCGKTWMILSDVSKSVLFIDTSMQNELIFALLSKYFNTENAPKSNRDISFRARMDHATTLMQFLCPEQERTTAFSSYEKLNEILGFHLLLYLDSPFIFHFESACFLIQSIFETTHLDLLPMRELCKAKLVLKLEQQIQSQFHRKTSPMTHQPGTLKTIKDSLYIGFTMVCKQNYSEKVAAAAIIELWNQASLFPKNDAVVKITADSMRINSHVVGTLIAGGIDCLPMKLTPIVRPLMTSIQNEVDGEYQHFVSSYMERLLRAIVHVPKSSARYGGLRKTFLKVLNNLCRLVIQEKKPSCAAASHVIGLLANRLQEGHTLGDIPPVWEIIVQLQELQMTGNTAQIMNALSVLKALCLHLEKINPITTHILDTFLPSLVNISCSGDVVLRKSSSNIIRELCSIDSSLMLDRILPNLISFLQDEGNDVQRSGACILLRDVLDSAEDISRVCPYVKVLLPIVMSMMIDPIKICAEISTSIFSILVRVAPLVKESRDIPGLEINEESGLVIDHLIHGKKLLPCEIHPKIANALRDGNITLRNYQREGISWLRFLQQINLNGALCDSMGLGKTLQALLGVSLAHMDYADNQKEAKSLVICPSSIVGHWVNEAEQYFPHHSIFHALALIGNSQRRSFLLKSKLETCNLVVTSYEVLRNEIRSLSKIDWTYCILDEGHLLRNPKTATAIASRQLRARHKLILTGTPIQNSVNELWATFDFLMPNFLGSSSQFSKQFSKPITKGQNLDAGAADIALGMEKLKVLHQQVLPFILRREKEQVLKELPPKIITRIPCPMSTLQEDLYERFCSNQQGKRSLSTLNDMLNSKDQAFTTGSSTFNPEVLKALLYLRLLCTHPWLVRAKDKSKGVQTGHSLYKLEVSGKLIALRELLRDAGLNVQNLTAADNDSSLLYCDKEDGSDIDDHEKVLEPDTHSSSENRHFLSNTGESRRCLIFAQFTHSLDVVEELLIKRHMPSVKYLRLDGKVPISKRSAVVDNFNNDESFKLMLLTTKVGGLGLNLTGADTVVFLEHDWNPHSDLQAMDRAHRLGQKRTVHVYQLVTMNSIEEKTMLLQERKLAMSKAIVNTDNSSMYSMGTDRLLDIFQFRSESSKSSTDTSEFEDTLDALVDRYQDEYQSLSLNDFLAGLESDN